MKSLRNRCLCLLVLLLGCYAGYGKTVLSKSTGAPVQYASVGIIDRNCGTLTDTLGNFTLKMDSRHINDSIRISCIGYITQTFAVKDFMTVPDTILLSENAVQLNEVVVKPEKIKHKIAGRKKGGGILQFNMAGDSIAGFGIAMLVKVKKRAWLKEIGFHNISDTLPNGYKPLSQMKFRVNFYRKEDDTYKLMNLKSEYFNYHISQLVDNSFAHTFSDEITLEKGEYYVELEFLENYSSEFFMFKASPLTGTTRMRAASHSSWFRFPVVFPIYVAYDTID